MTSHIIHVDGLIEALDLGVSFRTFLDDAAAELTTDHPAASRGLPVLVKDGTVYGPADLPGVTLILGDSAASGADLIEPARAAGWTVHVAAVA